MEKLLKKISNFFTGQINRQDESRSITLMSSEVSESFYTGNTGHLLYGSYDLSESSLGKASVYSNNNIVPFWE